MTKIENTIQINATPDHVWKFLGDLSRAPDYVPGVVTAEVEGLRRLCVDQDGNEIHEQMSDYSEKIRSFSFEHIKSPLPVKSSRGHFAVTGEGDQTTVTMTWEVEFLDPAMAKQMRSMLDQASKMTLNNIKEKTESG